MTQYRANVGPSSSTLAQHSPNTVSMFCVCAEVYITRSPDDGQSSIVQYSFSRVGFKKHIDIWINMADKSIFDSVTNKNRTSIP